MADIYSFWNRPKSIPVPKGTGMVPTLVEITDDNGVRCLRVSGYKDLNAEVAAYADTCDIYNILKRVGAGEVDLLSKGKGFYADVSGLPDNIQDIQRIMNDARRCWLDMDPAIRGAFNNDFNYFVANYDKAKAAQVAANSSVEVKYNESDE